MALYEILTSKKFEFLFVSKLIRIFLNVLHFDGFRFFVILLIKPSINLFDAHTHLGRELISLAKRWHLTLILVINLIEHINLLGLLPISTPKVSLYLLAKWWLVCFRRLTKFWRKKFNLSYMKFYLSPTISTPWFALFDLWVQITLAFDKTIAFT